MAVSRTKTWIDTEVLDASDLNAEFNNVLNNGEDLAWPATKAKDLDGQELILDADADTSIKASTNDQIDFKIAGADDFRMTANTFTALAGSSIVQTDGIMFIGDTANTNMTVGLTINQGANDDEILTLKSSDVAHGMTTKLETDSYGSLEKAEATSGGLRITGAKDADGGAGFALILQGYLGETASVGKDATSVGVVYLDAYVKTGSTTTTVGANGNLAVIANGGNTRFIFDAEGTAHGDDVWTDSVF